MTEGKGIGYNFEIVFREPTLIADALALGHPRLDVDQFPDGILLELLKLKTAKQNVASFFREEEPTQQER